MSLTAATPVDIVVNGRVVRTTSATTVLAALLNAGIVGVRRSVSGSERGALCGMGVCYECRVTIDGLAHRRSCMVLAAPGMRVTIETGPSA